MDELGSQKTWNWLKDGKFEEENRGNVSGCTGASTENRLYKELS